MSRPISDKIVVADKVLTPGIVDRSSIRSRNLASLDLLVAARDPRFDFLIDLRDRGIQAIPLLQMKLAQKSVIASGRPSNSATFLDGDDGLSMFQPAHQPRILPFGLR